MGKTLSILFLFLFSLSYGQTKTDLQKRNLKGNVKSILIESYDEDGDNSTTLNEQFNRNGFITFSHTEIHTSRISYKYSNYYENDRLTKKQYYLPYEATVDYFYSEDAQNVEMRTTNDAENVVENVIMLTLKNERVQQILEFDSFGNEPVDSAYFERSEQNLIESETHYSAQKITQRIERTHNQNGWLNEELEYNDKDQLVRSRIYVGGNPLMDKEFKDAVLQNTYTYHYTLDNQGNWTNCIVKKNGKAHSTIKVELQYY